MKSTPIESLNPSGYPIEQAFQAMDYYSAMQNGEPQMFVFGESIQHYALINVSKPNAFPRRKPILMDSHGDVKDIVDQLTVNAETSLELDPHKQYLLELLKALSEDPKDLSLTTVQEIEIETLEFTGLSFETIREAARVRSSQQEPGASPSIVMTNAETGESRELSLDAVSLIAGGKLGLERRREEDKGHRYGSITIDTMIRLDEYLTGAATELGLDVENVALVGQVGRGKTKTLHSAGLVFRQSTHPLLGSPLSVSSDVWSESGAYTPADIHPASENAPYRHRLNKDGINHRPVDDYDADNFLDAAQNVIDWHFKINHNLIGDEVVLQPIKPLELSLEALRQSVSEYQRGIFSLGYYVCSDAGYGTELYRDFKLVFGSDGAIAKSLAFRGVGGPRIDLENAALRFERIRTPIIKKIGHFALGKS